MITLSEEELIELTGYRAARKQVENLKQQGFWRARINRLGVAILERAHYETVCAGQIKQLVEDQRTPHSPKLRPVNRQHHGA